MNDEEVRQVKSVVQYAIERYPYTTWVISADDSTVTVHCGRFSVTVEARLLIRDPNVVVVCWEELAKKVMFNHAEEVKRLDEKRSEKMEIFDDN